MHGNHLYSNSIGTGTILARCQLFINFISEKVKDCIGVTYTATQSALETISARSQLFINFISVRVKDCIGVAYTGTQWALELFKLEVNCSPSSLH